MKQSLFVLTAIVGLGIAVPTYSDGCFDIYEIEKFRGVGSARDFRTVMNGDGSVCAIYRKTENSDSLVRIEILDGQGRLRYVKSYHYGPDDRGIGPQLEVIETRFADGQLFWRWISESNIFQLADGRQIDECQLYKDFPMFYWTKHMAEMQERACRVKN